MELNINIGTPGGGSDGFRLELNRHRLSNTAPGVTEALIVSAKHVGVTGTPDLIFVNVSPVVAHLHTAQGQRQIGLVPNAKLSIYVNGPGVIMPPGFEDWTICTTADADLGHCCLSIPDFWALLEIILYCICDNGGFPVNINVGTIIRVDKAVLRLGKERVGDATGFLDRGVLELDLGACFMEIKLTPLDLLVGWVNSRCLIQHLHTDTKILWCLTDSWKDAHDPPKNAYEHSHYVLCNTVESPVTFSYFIVWNGKDGKDKT